MSTRQEYLDEVKLQLDQWNMDIDNMEESAKNAGADMKAVHNKNFAILRKKRDMAEKKIEELENTTDSAWDDVKESYEKDWNLSN